MYSVQCLAVDVRHFIMYKHVWDCVFAVDATADDAEENEKMAHQHAKSFTH